MGGRPLSSCPERAEPPQASAAPSQLHRNPAVSRALCVPTAKGSYFVCTQGPSSHGRPLTVHPPPHSIRHPGTKPSRNHRKCKKPNAKKWTRELGTLSCPLRGSGDPQRKFLGLSPESLAAAHSATVLREPQVPGFGDTAERHMDTTAAPWNLPPRRRERQKPVKKATVWHQSKGRGSARIIYGCIMNYPEPSGAERLWLRAAHEEDAKISQSSRFL